MMRIHNKGFYSILTLLFFSVATASHADNSSGEEAQFDEMNEAASYHFRFYKKDYKLLRSLCQSNILGMNAEGLPDAPFEHRLKRYISLMARIMGHPSNIEDLFIDEKSNLVADPNTIQNVTDSQNTYVCNPFLLYQFPSPYVKRPAQFTQQPSERDKLYLDKYKNIYFLNTPLIVQDLLNNNLSAVFVYPHFFKHYYDALEVLSDLKHPSDANDSLSYRYTGALRLLKSYGEDIKAWRERAKRKSDPDVEHKLGNWEQIVKMQKHYAKLLQNLHLYSWSGIPQKKQTPPSLLSVEKTNNKNKEKTLNLDKAVSGARITEIIEEMDYSDTIYRDLASFLHLYNFYCQHDNIVKLTKGELGVTKEDFVNMTYFSGENLGGGYAATSAEGIMSRKGYFLSVGTMLNRALGVELPRKITNNNCVDNLVAIYLSLGYLPLGVLFERMVNTRIAARKSFGNPGDFLSEIIIACDTIRSLNKKYGISSKILGPIYDLNKTEDAIIGLTDSCFTRIKSKLFDDIYETRKEIAIAKMSEPLIMDDIEKFIEVTKILVNQLEIYSIGQISIQDICLRASGLQERPGMSDSISPWNELVIQKSQNRTGLIWDNLETIIKDTIGVLLENIKVVTTKIGALSDFDKESPRSPVLINAEQLILNWRETIDLPMKAYSAELLPGLALTIPQTSIETNSMFTASVLKYVCLADIKNNSYVDSISCFKSYNSDMKNNIAETRKKLASLTGDAPQTSTETNKNNIIDPYNFAQDIKTPTEDSKFIKTNARGMERWSENLMSRYMFSRVDHYYKAIFLPIVRNRPSVPCTVGYFYQGESVPIARNMPLVPNVDTSVFISPENAVMKQLIKTKEPTIVSAIKDKVFVFRIFPSGDKKGYVLGLVILIVTLVNAVLNNRERKQFESQKNPYRLQQVSIITFTVAIIAAMITYYYHKYCQY